MFALAGLNKTDAQPILLEPTPEEDEEKEVQHAEAVLQTMEAQQAEMATPKETEQVEQTQQKIVEPTPEKWIMGHTTAQCSEAVKMMLDAKKEEVIAKFDNLHSVFMQRFHHDSPTRSLSIKEMTQQVTEESERFDLAQADLEKAEVELAGWEDVYSNLQIIARREEQLKGKFSSLSL